MGKKIQVKRGTLANLPSLDEGEPGYTTDTQDFYIGNGAGTPQFVGGASVTASPDELNILDGVTATAADLNLLDGSIAGTAVASKALSLGVNKNVDTIAIVDGGLKLGAGAGTAVTATAAEINAVCDGGVTTMLALVYPVGCIYTTIIPTNPATVFGFGTWVAFGAGKVLVGLNDADADFDVVEETGGEKSHTITTTELPAHTHGAAGAHSHLISLGNNPGGGEALAATGSVGSEGTSGAADHTHASVGSDAAHNNLQPYIVVYFWKRTA